jgi:hypothetical protein
MTAVRVATALAFAVMPMPTRIPALILILGAAYPAAAVPVSMELSDPTTSFFRLTLVASDGFDTVMLLEEESPPTGGTVDAELLGVLDPGLDVSRVSLGSETVTYSGTVPGVGPFSITIVGFEVHLLGNPLNTQGRIMPGGGFGLFLATGSAGKPTGVLTVSGISTGFDLGELQCTPSCGTGVMMTTTNADLEVQELVDATEWRDVNVLTVDGVDFAITVDVLWLARYAVPQPVPPIPALGGPAVAALAILLVMAARHRVGITR